MTLPLVVARHDSAEAISGMGKRLPRFPFTTFRASADRNDGGIRAQNDRKERARNDRRGANKRD